MVRPGQSDSATLDNVLELLTLAGRSLPHALMMMIPEAYRNRDGELSAELGGFYAYHSCMMEPWDGPAAVAFSDGRLIGATLDRNGLRPGRWLLRKDGLVVLGSEAGLLPTPADQIERLGSLQPGKLFLIDLEQGRIVPDAEIKHEIATQQPYGAWYDANTVRFEQLPRSEAAPLARATALAAAGVRLQLRGPDQGPSGDDPWRRGAGRLDGQRHVAGRPLRRSSPALFHYFKQLFAQVTNPPIDPIRESIVMSISAGLGAERNLLSETPEHAHQMTLDQPILRNHELEAPAQRLSRRLPCAHDRHHLAARRRRRRRWRRRSHRVCDEAHAAIAENINIIILSDRAVGPDRAPIPSLLAVAAVHHHLVREGTRLRTGLVIESGEPREVHHIATLIGYGASVVNPYVMFETARRARR